MKLNKKNKLLIAGLILGLYIGYTYAISNTLLYYRKYKEQQNLLAINSNDPTLLKKLVYKEKQLDSLLLEYGHHKEGSFQNLLLQELSSISKSNSLRIIDFQEPHIVSGNDITTSSYIFSLEGSFNGILLLLNTIENNPSLGVVKHINFSKKTNYKTNTDYLTAEIILQKTDSKIAGKST